MKFVKYNESYLDLLEKYFKHPDTPYNNSNHDMFLTELYDDEKGVLFLAIDNDEIVGTNSAILVNKKNISSIKYPHRLHVRKDYSNLSKSMTNKEFDQLLCNWIIEKNIDNLYCTFNREDYVSFMWSAIKHKKRKQNKYISKAGQKIIEKKWIIHHKMIHEYIPQYVMYTSLNDNWFYPWRKEYVIEKHIETKLNSFLEYIPGVGWIL